jgi:aminoglycoside phosphotransferase family enzyme/predicted kinase
MAATPAKDVSQDEVVAFLASGAAFGGKPPCRIDTHAAHVFLTGERAWKLKRAVRFNYLDFSRPELRRAMLEAELRLNRRTAPMLYRAVHPVVRDASGQLAIGGEGEPVDWLLEMRRFPDGALLSDVAEREALAPSILMRLADRIAAFHQSAEPAYNAGSSQFRDVVVGNLASMSYFPALLSGDRIAALRARLLDELDDRASLLDARARAGRVRHGHGDLHLANIAMIDGELVPFDCVEFSDTLATVDVLYDLAFLLMDLWRSDLRAEANLLFNRYVDVSAVDEDGVALMPLFLSTRAAVRCHVLAAQGKNDAARFHLELALAFLTPFAPRLIAIGGLSGTGKSTLARAIGESIGRAPGARILRSDVLRKQLAGVPPETRLPAEGYTAQASRDVYDLLEQRAAMVLAAAQSAIADAVFARTDERRSIAAVARSAGVHFTGLWLTSEGQTRIDRVGRRGPDASDAGEQVARLQSHYEVGALDDWRVIDAGVAPAELADQALALLASR